ncbi:MFS transporter [Candidatus Aerophobetes bacterium]|uniref:MFS transporter n=1 Tax=Aerophobetes bacterium TaxID=2030807 RepID=A0A523W5C2_UNCAE|nr:MAG: MFS transporter [Candidatus Aerophobetes bacterium]
MRENSSGNLTLIMASHGFVHILFISLAAILPLIRLEFGLSYTQIGVFTFALSVIAAVASIPMGFISDRVNKLRLISSMFFLVAIVASFFVVVRSLTFVLLLLSFLWLCLSIFHPSSMAYLSSRYPSKRGEIFGLYELGASFGMIVAPVIAVWIASIWGWKSVYGVYVLPAIFVALGIYRIAGREVPSRQNGHSSLGEEFLHGLKEILTHRRLKFIYLVHGLSAVIFGSVSLYLPIFMVDVHGLDVLQAGYVLTLFFLGGALGKMLGGKSSDRWARNRVMGLSFLLLIPFLILLSLTRGTLILVVLSFAAGLTSHMIMPAVTALIGDNAQNEIGLSYGIHSLVGFGFAATSRLVAGILADLWGISAIFWLLAGVSFLGVVCSFLLLERNDFS